MGNTYSAFYYWWYINSDNIGETLDKLDKQSKNLSRTIVEMEEKSNNLLLSAKKEYRRNKNDKALTLMKIRKLYDQEIAKIEQLMFCISAQELALNSSSTLKDSMSTIKDASSIMQMMNTNIDLSKIETTLETVTDTHDLNTEIQETLSTVICDSNNTSEDDLLSELKLLCDKTPIEETVIVHNKPIEIIEQNKPGSPPMDLPYPPSSVVELSVFDRVADLENNIPDINRVIDNNKPDPKDAIAVAF